MLESAAQLRDLGRLALRSLRARGEGERPPVAPRRRVAVERSGVVLHPRKVAAYLRATAGEGIAAFAGEGAVVPPTYCATWEAGLVLELLLQLDTPLPAGGVVHLETELLPLRLLRPGDRARCRVELERSEATPRGVRLTVSQRAWNAAGHLCSQGSSVYLVRARDDGPRPPRDDTPTDLSGWKELARWELRSGAGRRYARASGDYNPIHLWGWTARPFGFRRPVLHGFCTQAMVAHALAERRFGGDPGALRRLRAAFRAPVLLPAQLRLLVREDGAAGSFRVVDGAGERVHAEGSWLGG